MAREIGLLISGFGIRAIGIVIALAVVYTIGSEAIDYFHQITAALPAAA